MGSFILIENTQQQPQIYHYEVKMFNFLKKEGKSNMGNETQQSNYTKLHLENYTSETRKWISNSQKLADSFSHKEVEPIHLLVYALESMPNIVEVFKKSGVDVEELLNTCKSTFKKMKKSNEKSYLSQNIIDLFKRAEEKAAKAKVDHTDLEHLLYALSQEVRGMLGNIFSTFKITPGMFEPYTAILYKDDHDIISSFAKDMVTVYKENNGEPVIGRTDEIRRVIDVLKRKGKNHTLIAGEVGIGKFSIVRGLASRLAMEDVPKNLIGVRMLRLDIHKLLGSRNSAEERIEELQLNINKYDNKTIIVIRDFDSLFMNNNMINSSNLLKPLFNNKKVSFLATVSLEGAKKVASKDSNILQLFTRITIDPPTEDQAIEVVRGIAETYSEYHGINIDESAIVSSVKLAKRYIQDKNLPESAIDLLDETCARKYYESIGHPSDVEKISRRIKTIKHQEQILETSDDDLSITAKLKLSEEREKLITENNSKEEVSTLVSEIDIAKTLGDWTGIPVSKMLEAEADRLMKMETSLQGRIVGQDEALVAVSKAIRRSRVGLRDPSKPIGSFLFLGPSGVGKTELTKALAEFLFDDESALVRLDMSEFMEKHMAQRLLGSPPGYADSDQGGFLTEAVKRKPYSILLFDEIEKGHPDVFNLLLQLLDDGRLTDGRGNTTDFSNTIVVMTSNLGAQKILDINKKAGDVDTHEEMRKMLTDELRAFLRPEFINRIDDIVVFRHLSKKNLHGIIDIQLKKLRKLLNNKQIKITLTDSAKKELVEMSFDPAFGARPLNRSIVRNIQNPLAEWMLKEQNMKGKVISVDFVENEFKFSYN